MRKIGAYSSEKHLTANIQNFFDDPTLELFVLQCNTITDTPHILHAKSIIDQTRSDYLQHHLNTPERPHKHLLIVLHLQRGIVATGNERWQLNFQCGWGQVTIDTIEESTSGIPLSSMLTGTVEALLSTSEAFSLNRCIQESVTWALSCIKYPITSDSIYRILWSNYAISYINYRL